MLQHRGRCDLALGERGGDRDDLVHRTRLVHGGERFVVGRGRDLSRLGIGGDVHHREDLAGGRSTDDRHARFRTRLRDLFGDQLLRRELQREVDAQFDVVAGLRRFQDAAATRDRPHRRTLVGLLPRLALEHLVVLGFESTDARAVDIGGTGERLGLRPVRADSFELRDQVHPIELSGIDQRGDLLGRRIGDQPVDVDEPSLAPQQRGDLGRVHGQDRRQSSGLDGSIGHLDRVGHHRRPRDRDGDVLAVAVEDRSACSRDRNLDGALCDPGVAVPARMQHLEIGELADGREQEQTQHGTDAEIATLQCAGR